MDIHKRLYRSDRDAVFAGICGGLGEYLEVDPVIIRLIWLLVVIFTGVVPGLLVYIIAIYIIPKESIVRGTPPTQTAPPSSSTPESAHTTVV